MRWKEYQGFAWGLIMIGLAIVTHHLIITGRLFDWGDILHHEFFAITLFSLALGALLLLPKSFRKPPKIQT